MAVSGAPTGRKVSGHSTPGSRAGRPAGSRGTKRTKLPLNGGNPSGGLASLVSGAQSRGKLAGAD